MIKRTVISVALLFALNGKVAQAASCTLTSYAPTGRAVMSGQGSVVCPSGYTVSGPFTLRLQFQGTFSWFDVSVVTAQLNNVNSRYVTTSANGRAGAWRDEVDFNGSVVISPATWVAP